MFIIFRISGQLLLPQSILFFLEKAPLGEEEATHSPETKWASVPSPFSDGPVWVQDLGTAGASVPSPFSDGPGWVQDSGTAGASLPSLF